MRTLLLILWMLCCVTLVQPFYTYGTEQSESLNNRGMLELQSGNNSTAAEYFRQAITKDPSKKNYYNNLAAAYIRMNDYYNAEQQLLMAITIDPVYTKALANMSVVMFKTGRYRESYDYYVRAKKTDSSYTATRFERNRVLERLKEESRLHPENEELKKIIIHMENSSE